MRYLRAIPVGIALLTASPVRAEDAAAGKALYEQNCSKCHGIAGDGKGRAGKALDPKPTDFTTAKFDEAAWFRIIKIGSKAAGKSNNMDPYGKLLTDDEIRAVMAYCKTFKH